MVTRKNIDRRTVGSMQAAVLSINMGCGEKDADNFHVVRALKEKVVGEDIRAVAGVQINVQITGTMTPGVKIK